LPNLQFAYSGDIWIKFRTDEASAAKGFMLHFQTASNVMLTADSGEVASPGMSLCFHFAGSAQLYFVTQVIQTHFTSTTEHTLGQLWFLQRAM
jgi:hypothetical protein